jgi:lipoate-protein ligase A
VVIGKGSAPALEVYLNNAEQDHIPILRRATGGCAVVLSPEEMVVASFTVRTEDQLPSKEYFRLFLRIIIHALEAQGIQELSHKGISDIALGDRKVAGTAIYRNRQLVFFHAVINTGGSTDPMQRYLKHPQRTPDYRAERPHRKFVTSLREHGYTLDLAAFERDVRSEFERIFGRGTGSASEAA